jgi:hypothetical protein
VQVDIDCGIIESQGDEMTKYQVHFEKASSVGYVRRGRRTIIARNEAEAIIKCKSVVANSFGHWVNRLANEPA